LKSQHATQDRPPSAPSAAPRKGKDKTGEKTMRLATSYEAICKAALPRLCLRPAVGFSHPTDVIRDPHLDLQEKRTILSSWASDASAVEDEPTQRWLLGTPGPVPYSEVRHALAELDRREAQTPVPLGRPKGPLGRGLRPAERRDRQRPALTRR
jgi:hypothetical protein